MSSITIPVPWGHVAGKAWGDPSGKKVLGLHGHQDNAGTFDRLAPLLSPSFYFVAIDFPGQGQSSHIPAGFTYNFPDMVMVVKRIAAHLEWKKFSIIGHSMGGAAGTLYAGVYPDNVENLVLLDIIKLRTTKLSLSASALRSTLDMFFTQEERCKRMPDRSCAYDSALAALNFAIGGRLTDEAARALLARGIQRVGPDSYKFTRDIRLRCPQLLQYRHDEVQEFLKAVQCRVMYLRGKEVPPIPAEELHDEALEIYKSYAKDFQYHEVEGNHFFHLNNPEEAASLINEYLNDGDGM